VAGGFEALDDLFDDSLTLPVKGVDGTTRRFVIASPPGEDGLRVQNIVTLATRLFHGGEAVDTTVLNDDEEIDLFRLALGGEVYADLCAFAPWSRVRHAAMTAVFWVVSGRQAAERYWKAGRTGEAPAPNREARRHPKKSGSGAAKSTPRRGSTSGTSGRKGGGKPRKGDRT
jgi:hypothetical protein